MSAVPDFSFFLEGKSDPQSLWLCLHHSYSWVLMGRRSALAEPRTIVDAVKVDERSCEEKGRRGKRSPHQGGEETGIGSKWII
jgi:hypothetical protein